MSLSLRNPNGADVRLRRLERLAAAAPGDHDLRVRLLAQRVRAGVVPVAHLAAAAYLDRAAEDAAGLLGVEPFDPEWEEARLPPPVDLVFDQAGTDPLLAWWFAADAVSRALPCYEAVRPGDARPRGAVGAVRRWLWVILSAPRPPDELAREEDRLLDATDRAEAARSELPPWQPEADSATRVALRRADEAAFAAASLASSRLRGLDPHPLWLARLAAFSGQTPPLHGDEDEAEWQAARLAEYLLGDRVPAW